MTRGVEDWQAPPDPGARTASLPAFGDRYEGRVYSLARLARRLAEPPKPVAWRVRGLVADGTVTVLSSESGLGKSWLAQAVCGGVAAGEQVAGLECV